MFVLAEFDPDAARRALHADLELKRDEPGFMALYSASTGWGIAPYTSFFVAVPVEGHDSSDGSCGYMMVEGFYSGRAGSVMHESYNRRLVPGFSRQSNDGRVWYGEAGPAEQTVVELRVSPVLPRPEVATTAGVHHYLGESASGGLNIYSVAYSGEFYPASDVEIEFRPAASPLLRSLAPLSIPYGSILPAAPLTFSPPRPVSVSVGEMATESARVSLLDVLSRFGRPAALVTHFGRVVFLNQEGEALLSDVIVDGRLRTWRTSEQRRLDTALSSNAEGGLARLSEPITLERPDSGRPLLLQLIPMSAALAGEPASLVLFSDPLGPANTDPTSALELLGLTRAEARIAAQVGKGLSPRAAGTELSLTENTVRSSLQIVYDKLGIRRQSELARVVARLDGFGTPAGRASLGQGVL